MPGYLYMDAALIILQVHRNVRLLVQGCGNYNTTVQEQRNARLPVQGSGNYNITSAEEYQAPCTGM
jgi:hypothetical protein